MTNQEKNNNNVWHLRGFKINDCN